MARRLRVFKGRLPRPKKPPGVQYAVATPQQLAGTTISQTTTDPRRVRLSPGMAIQYDANGKPIGFVRINESTMPGQSGLAQGVGISYDASGKPSLTTAPGYSGGSSGGSNTAIPSSTSSTQGSGAFGDSAYRNSTLDRGGIWPSYLQGINNKNFGDQQYLMQMGYTPEQAAAAIRSNPTSIADPNNPTGPRLQTDSGSLQPGALDWNQVDVSNPYSRAGMLVKSYRGAVQGTNTGMAAGGHGRSGAALTAQQQNSTNFGAGQSQWNQDLQGYVADSNERRIGMGDAANQGILGAMQEFITRQANVPTIESPEGNKTAIPATGSFILGNQAGNGLPSYNEWIAQYGGDAKKFPQLANGWSVEIKDGRIVRFIPPGGA